MSTDLKSLLEMAHSELRSNLDLLAAWIEAQMALRGQPGLSIAIVHDQEMIWAKGFGFGNVEKQVEATPRTIYRIASITKLFTSTALLQLRDAGRLQLDDPITKHLPWFNIVKRYPNAPVITIRHLITHTSGLPREVALPYWTDGNFPTREQVKELLPQQETVFPTDTRWKYSNLALALAGEIVSAVSGHAYPEYIQQHILDPLDMASTFVESPNPNHPQLATGYGRRLPGGSRQLSPFTDSKGITPAANMSTSVLNLARFAMLQFRDGPESGSQILRGSTLREMQRIHWLEPEWQAGWGLGFRITRENNKTYIGHGGAVLGFRTQLRICPENKIAVIVFTNADDGEPLVYAQKAFEWVAPAITKAAKEESKAREPDPGWQRYVGKYRDAWSDSQVILHKGQLTLIEPFSPDPLLTSITLLPVAEHTFRMEGKNGFASLGELAVFDLDAEGQVQAVKIGQNYAYPVTAW